MLDPRAGVVKIAFVAPKTAEPETHAPLPVAEEYHWYEKVEVPPDSWEVSVTSWPLSMNGDDGVTAPADRVGLTTTTSHAEPALSGPAELLSVTT
jgi:hypothetical protein